MATTLQQIMAELDPYYQGSRGIYKQQLEALPGQGEAEVKGLDAKLAVANDNILEGARSRGLGFSGVPVGEQTKYAATEYAPAVARVKQGQQQQQTSILEALNGLDRDQVGRAQTIFDNAEQRRIQEAQLAEQRRQFDEQQRAAAASSGSGGGGGLGAGAYLGDTGGGGGGSNPQEQAAYNSVRAMLDSKNLARIGSELAAIKRSAGFGNTMDKLKLQIISGMQKNSGYGDLINRGWSYKAPKPAAKTAPKPAQLFGLKNIASPLLGGAR